MVQSPYYGDSYYRTPPPDLPSLLLKERIIYLGLPIVYQVTELIVAQLLYLQYEDPEKPIYFYINSTGTSRFDGEPVAWETEAFAICDTMTYIKPPVHTICIGMAMGMAAVLLAGGSKGNRASLPNASIILRQSRSYTRGQASDIQIQAQEVLHNRAVMLDILAENTGQSREKVAKDMSRTFYMTPHQAKEYGLIDRILESTRQLPQAVASLALPGKA